MKLLKKIGKYFNIKKRNEYYSYSYTSPLFVGLQFHYIAYPHAPGLHAYGHFTSDASQTEYRQGFAVKLATAIQFPVPATLLHALASWHNGTRQSAN